MISYVSWRILFIAVRPVLILGSGLNTVVGDELIISQAVMYAGFMMAALSCGTFKEKLQTGASENRRFLFLIWIFVAILSAIILPLHVSFIVLYILLEYILHDESRIILYSGNRTLAIKLNFLRLAPCLLLLIIPAHLHNSFLIFLIFFNLINFRHQTFSLLYKFKRPKLPSGNDLKSLINFFVQSFLSKFSSNSDRFLFSLINLENLWTYMLISQIFSSLYQYYDIRYISKIKERIVKSEFKHKPKIGKNELILFPLLVGMMTSGFLTYSSYTVENFNIIIALFMISSPLLLITMIHSEHFFWKNVATEIRNVEVVSLVFATLLGVLIFIAGFSVLSRGTVIVHSISKLTLIKLKTKHD